MNRPKKINTLSNFFLKQTFKCALTHTLKADQKYVPKEHIELIHINKL